MSRDPLEYIRTAYNAPAHVGGRVQFVCTDTSIRYGTITGGDHHLHVAWDGGGTARLHPVWHVTYIDKDGLLIPRETWSATP